MSIVTASESLTGTFGTSLFIGNVVGAYLYGALTVQIYSYYMSFPEDSRLFKTIIYAIYLIETVYTILLTYSWGQYLFNSDYFPFPGLIFISVFGPIVALLTQCIYAYRIRVISRLKFLSWCIVVSIASGAIATVVTTAVEFYTTAYFEVPVLVWSSVSLLTDLIIASVLIWSLTKDQILSKGLRSRVMRLVYIIIGTGLLTVAVNIITIVAGFIPLSPVISPSIVLSKLYANSMMVFVNDRISSKCSQDDRVDTSNTVTVHVGSLCFAGGPSTTIEADGEETSTGGVTEIGISTQVAAEHSIKRNSLSEL